MTLDDICFPTHDLKLWVKGQLETQGPWQLKPCFKQKLNCLLHYWLSGCSADALHIREYLCDEDPDYVWTLSLQNTVLPYLQYTLRIHEVTYG